MRPEPFEAIGGAALVWAAGDAVPVLSRDLAAKELTVGLKSKGGWGAESSGRRRDASPRLLWRGEGGGVVLAVAEGLQGSVRCLVADVGMDFRAEPLRVSVPLSALGESESCVVVLRLSEAKLDLFADGVLVDEEWPLGSLPAPEGRLEIGSGIQWLALWPRALDDGELGRLAGGSDSLAARADRMLGPERPVGQFWRPRGFNVNVGDCMPFYHEGRYHLFYLYDRRRHQSRWGLGGHQWAHLSTTDLVRWEHHPLAVPLAGEPEGSICTGSLFYHEGTFLAFYSVRTIDRSACPIFASTSADCIHFVKHPPLARLTAPYKPEDGRDPVVFRDRDTGDFHMLVTTALADPPPGGHGGCLAHLVSRDLRKWEQREPFIVPGIPGQPECPDYFEWHGWHYLLFSNQGITTYRMSRHALGPWSRPEPDGIGGPGLVVMKTAAFTGDRRIGAAFTREDGYGGSLVFREIIQNPDGTLGSKWPSELPP